MGELVSIIVPVYNTEKYIEKCIKSIQNQKYKDLEIILVDDGSTDHSGIICDEYVKKDERISKAHEVASHLCTEQAGQRRQGKSQGYRNHSSSTSQTQKFHI